MFEAVNLSMNIGGNRVDLRAGITCATGGSIICQGTTQGCAGSEVLTCVTTSIRVERAMRAIQDAVRGAGVDLNFEALSRELEASLGKG